MDVPPPRTVLPSDWYDYVVVEGVDEGKPGIYEWRIAGVHCYIGKYKKISRPTRAYGRNVANLANGKPYRPKNPAGFRYIHRALQTAHATGQLITLTILENVDPATIDARERDLIAERGSLNAPPFGGRSGAIRHEIEERGIVEADVVNAVAWARSSSEHSTASAGPHPGPLPEGEGAARLASPSPSGRGPG